MAKSGSCATGVLAGLYGVWGFRLLARGAMRACMRKIHWSIERTGAGFRRGSQEGLVVSWWTGGVLVLRWTIVLSPFSAFAGPLRQAPRTNHGRWGNPSRYVRREVQARNTKKKVRDAPSAPLQPRHAFVPVESFSMKTEFKVGIQRMLVSMSF